MSDKLKLDPCKHCGGEAHVWEGPDYYKVACSNQYKCSARVGPFDTEKEAIAAWNNRPVPHKYTVEELIEMDNKPVWVEWLNIKNETQISEWALVCIGKETVESISTIYRFEYYNKTWVAYDREPEANKRDNRSVG